MRNAHLLDDMCWVYSRGKSWSKDRVELVPQPANAQLREIKIRREQRLLLDAPRLDWFFFNFEVGEFEQPLKGGTFVRPPCSWPRWLP